MVHIIFKKDNNDNNQNNTKDDGFRIEFDCDGSKTIKEMILDFIKNNNSYLKIASKDIKNFEQSLSPALLTFIFKAKILNNCKNLDKKVSQLFKTNNNALKIIDTGTILGGKIYILVE